MGVAVFSSNFELNTTRKMKPNIRNVEKSGKSGKPVTPALGKPATPSAGAQKKSASKKPAKDKHDHPTCADCKACISDDTAALNCDRCCEIWKCTTCLGLVDDSYNLLAHTPCLKWFCDGCNHEISSSDVKVPDKVMNILDEILQRSKSIEQRLSDIESALEEKADKAAVQELEKRVEIIEHKLSGEIDTKLKMLNERVRSEGESTISDNRGPVQHSDFDNVTAEHVNVNVDLSLKEMQDRSRRKQNLIIFNIPECSSEDREERKLYDISEAVDIFNDLKIESSVSNPVRLGLRATDSKYPRPLRISVPDEETKWKIIKDAKNLATLGKENRAKIYIKRDMTPLEREQDAVIRKKLVEMRQREEEKGGKEQWIIWRGKVVKRRH